MATYMYRLPRVREEKLLLSFKWSSINLSDEGITKQNIEVILWWLLCLHALLFAVDGIMLLHILGIKYRMFDFLAVHTTTLQK